MLRKICFAECGTRPPLPRVLGGKEAIPHSWPWQAMIKVKRRQDGGWEHRCGASLIHPEWIVTAAHCLAFQPNPRIYRIVLGLYMRKKKNTRNNTHRTHKDIPRLRTCECARIQPQALADRLAAKQANQHTGTTNMAGREGNTTGTL